MNSTQKQSALHTLQAINDAVCESEQNSAIKPANDEFQLNPDPTVEPFALEQTDVEESIDSSQAELFLAPNDSEHPEPSSQIEFAGMAKPVLAIELNQGRKARYQHASSLLESLEAQDIEVHYQCRDGYCGSCRTTLLEGQVHYTQEPMAWINDDEILPCCCIPKTDLKLEL